MLICCLVISASSVLVDELLSKYICMFNFSFRIGLSYVAMM